MSHPSAPEEEAAYELTVVGAIGPVLRAALLPSIAQLAHACTILRTTSACERDLVDLLFLLHLRGFEVEGIFETSPAGA